MINEEGKILVQKRAKNESKLWPGYYALPVGHIDEGENQYDALVMEAKEEFNIVIDPQNILKEYNGIPIIAEEDKCEELKWVDINELPELFVNYEGDFFENKDIKTYYYETNGVYGRKK